MVQIVPHASKEISERAQLLLIAGRQTLPSYSTSLILDQ